MRDLYGRLKTQGFNILSVNQGDSAEVINKLRADEKHTFPMVMNKQGGPDVPKLYGVVAYPTNYLIGADGKILARFVGFNEKALLDELKKAGFKL